MLAFHVKRAITLPCRSSLTPSIAAAASRIRGASAATKHGTGSTRVLMRKREACVLARRAIPEGPVSGRVVGETRVGRRSCAVRAGECRIGRRVGDPAASSCPATMSWMAGSLMACVGGEFVAGPPVLSRVSSGRRIGARRGPAQPDQRTGAYASLGRPFFQLS